MLRITHYSIFDTGTVADCNYAGRDRRKAFRGQSCVITHNFGHLSWLLVTTQVARLKAFSLQPAIKDSSLLEPKVVETEKVLNGLIRALRDNL